MTTALIEQLRAARVYDLEQPRYFGMPIYPSHKPGYHYALHRRHRDAYKPAEDGQRSGASGMLTMMEHTGTHIDALCHQACDLKLYGGVPIESVETAAGFTQLGVERISPIVARGVLLDIAGWKGQAPLPRRYSIPAGELSACAEAQNVAVRAGDVLLVRTGYGALWNDEAAYLDAAGVAKSGSVWAGERGVAAIGIDNMSWDTPGERDPDSGSLLFAHVYLLPRKGIYIMENLNLEELARDRRYEFAFLATPLKLVGATGSPIRPLAMV